MKLNEAKQLQKMIFSTCSIKEANILVVKEDLPTPNPNYELHLLDVTFDEGLCVQAIADKLNLKVIAKDDVTIISTPKD